MSQLKSGDIVETVLKDRESRSEPLKLRQLAQMVQPLWSDAQIKDFVNSFRDLPVYKLFHAFPESGHKLGLLLDAALIIVYKKTESSKKVHLLYDGRYDDRLENVPDLRKVFVVLGPREQFWSMEETDNDKPRLFVANREQYKPLSTILQLEVEEPDPKNVAELKAFFERCRLPQGTRVKISVVCVSVPSQKTVYSAKYTFGSGQPDRVFDIQARPGPDYNFVFKMLPQKEVQRKVSPPQEPTPAADPKCKSLFYKNRSCATRFGRYGLNLAYDLGLLTYSDLARMSAELGDTVATFSAHCDEKMHLRILVYNDNFGDPISLVVDCKNEKPERSIEFFEAVESRRKLLEKKRLAVMQPLWSKLKLKSLQRTKYQSLLQFSKTYIKKQKILFYDETDNFMHNFKFLFAMYIYSKSKKGMCRIPLILDPSNKIISMQTPEFCIINLFPYVKCNKDTEFISLVQDGSVKISHRWLTLKKRIEPGGPTAFERCVRHSELLSKQLLRQWDLLRCLFLENFSFDVSATSVPSLARLSYDAVESKLAFARGPLGQGREKLKLPYDELLRSFNYGGFTFSMRGKLNCGETLNTKSEHTAKEIAQYDIVSCYGYSAMTHFAPGKFCKAFFTQEFLKQLGQDPQFSACPSELVKTDGDRWKTFEFRAAYFTLWKLLSTENKNIRTVYSNFSSFGVFNINKFILDLAVVFEDGSMKMFNFDSIYSHGCESCPLISRYINNTPFHALRIKTLKRDAAINNWVKNSGLPNVEYRVYTDCHHQEYSTSALKKSFRDISELKSLQQRCPTAKKLTQEQLLAWLTLNATEKDYTYLAWVRGDVSKCDGCLTPLASPSLKQSQSGCQLGSSTGDKPVLLTRSYLEFLISKCNFQVSSIDAIFFFGTDPKAQELYLNLATARSQTSDPVVSDFFKTVTNYSVGFYGRNSIKTKAKCTLTNRLPRKSKVRVHQIVSSLGVKDFKNGPMLFVYKMQRTLCTANYAGYLPFHVTVIENGKLRLVEFITFLQRHLYPDSFKLLYSNIDSVHLAFGRHLWSELVPPDKYENFSKELSHFLSDLKTPGKFVLDWTVAEKFMYVTAKTKNYAIVSGGFEKNKWSGVSNLHPLEAYFHSCQLLESGTCLTQERRTNVLQSTETEIKKMFFKPVGKLQCIKK